MKGMYNTQRRPARTWKRGENVTIKWARNNHNNGFIRFAIVPVQKMMDRSWHRKLAIFYGCWAQGAFLCSGYLCGVDGQGIGFKRVMQIPSIYPDGDYVFAMVWYGGVHLPVSKESYFSDYYSCSFVRIEGGTAVGGVYQPVYKTDMIANDRRGRIDGTCFAAIDEPGVCENDGCDGPPQWTVPRRFKNNSMPDPISVGIVRRAMLHEVEYSPGNESNSNPATKKTKKT